MIPAPSSIPAPAHRADLARLFVATLFHASADGLIELRWWRNRSPARQIWFHRGDPPNWQRLLQTLDDAHVFAGLATRRKSDDGSRANCLALPAVFIDADLKGPDTAAEFIRALQDFPLPPTMVIRSGSGWGLHVYWVLADPHVVMGEDGAIDGDAERAWQRVQLGLAQHFKTDPSVHDLPRVMRLPGSKNLKPHNGPGAVVQILRIHPDRRYRLNDFDPWRASAEGVTPPQHKPPVWSDPDNEDAVDFAQEFGRRGWLLSDQGGGMWYVRCPWAEQHSEGGTKSGTAIWMPDEPGWAAGFRCLHMHCGKRRTREVYEYFRLMRAASTLRGVSA